MSITAAGSLGIFLTIASWGRYADYAGSANAMFWSMIGHAVCALACVALIPGAQATNYALWAVFIALGSLTGRLSGSSPAAVMEERR